MGDYSEELVELVRHAADKALGHPVFPPLIDAILDALSAAGRLVPEDGPPRACGCPRIYRVGLDPVDQDGCEIIEAQRRESAELAAWQAEVDRLATPWTPAEPAQRGGVAAPNQNTKERNDG